MLPSDSSPQRFLRAVLGDPDGSPFRRALYYVSRLAIGGVIGFFILAMATPSRERGGGEGFSLDLYLAAIGCGAVLMLVFAIVPRLLHPKDWPTRDEFRRGNPPPERDRPEGG